MVTFTHKISDPNGLHAINAARLAQFSMGHECGIHVACKGSAANARQLMGLMRLRAKYGDVLEFRIDGTSEEETAEELKTLAKGLL